MKLQRELIDNRDEVRLLAGLIWSEDFGRTIAPALDITLLSSKPTRKLAKWVCTYWQKYHSPPQQDVRDAVSKNDDDFNVTQELLKRCEQELPEIPNVERLVDLVEEYLRRRALEQTLELVKDRLDNGEVTAACQELQRFTPPSVSSESQNVASDPYTDHEAVWDAFENGAGDPIVKFPGAFGDYVNEFHVRGGFIAYLGPIKRGKSFLLQETATWARRCNRCVAHFSFGDMSKREMIRRQAISITGRSDQWKYCGDFIVPIADCQRNQKGDCPMDGYGRSGKPSIVPTEFGEQGRLKWTLEAFKQNPNYRPCTACRNVPDVAHEFKPCHWHRHATVKEVLTWREAWKAMNRSQKIHRPSRYKMMFYPAGTATIDDMRRQLDVWEKTEGFIADVIIGDYADLMAPVDKRIEFRHGQDSIWKGWRGLAHERNALAVTATQAAARSFTKASMTKSDFSEDVRKLAHATVVFGLNQLLDEQLLGLLRVGKVVVREGASDAGKEVTLLQSLRQGRPILDSY